jgi:hypothetical protein
MLLVFHSIYIYYTYIYLYMLMMPDFILALMFIIKLKFGSFGLPLLLIFQSTQYFHILSLLYIIYQVCLPCWTDFKSRSRVPWYYHVQVYTNRNSGAKSEKTDGWTDTKLPVRNTFSENIFRNLRKNRNFVVIPIGKCN